MARTVTMTGRDWMILWRTVQQAPALPEGAPLEARMKLEGLYRYLRKQMKAHEGEPTDTEISIRMNQTRRITARELLGSPKEPWPLATKIEVIEPIMEKLGWTPPAETDDDDGEDDDGIES